MPGGVGPMTVAMLLRNTVFAWTGHVGLRSEDQAEGGAKGKGKGGKLR